ncbi:YCF48-related protein [Tuwongella immobilis]|uniref:Photosynthesis system II assembly factor Ycf48/Hcf136-like domain-containing protein n=1 Tax=Tuwongella immobilis TaxID=692036 RepID=A0A6C2YND9_9BACT|nr:YCF48-related protein [Tuwongella immobilis]VIP02719.1 photosystem ii stability assembly factor : Uncharacterized protein OS=Planctomyces maris DSM 8797 GN=PM8797T_07347 PE=4 SV=1: PSII_BNR [Tuwongella immobilis]VTS02248.1 photosystem ii stability assembly factor : Uncharacterized protein OS=Planctomyces maris DSM 8797 GN=PM8797T_07347 PE=4 SV=1: PSII_BNR [Tuwongella immobilis]
MQRTILAWLGSLLLLGRLDAAPTPFFNDAPLRAVQFVDRNEGWAVGDDGTIWHTIDSGTTWERQPSGTRASLRAVHFLTPYTGWIVGRMELPSGGNVGVVLHTTDGGLTWDQVTNGELPALNVVKSFDEKTVVVAGDGNEAFPTGIFRSVNGGRTWQPVAGNRSPSWLAGDFVDSENGTLGGAWSRLAPIRNGRFAEADVDLLSGRSVRSMKIVGQRAVAVGQGGLVMLSRDSAGVRWGFATVPMNPETLACLDFNGVAMLDSHLWVVGRPGSVILHSPDFGKSWDVLKTPRTVPLHAVHFISHEEGWAVGEFGTILATADGGKTWKVQREGAQRSGLLAIHAQPDALNLETVALLGHEQGYISAAMIVTSPDATSSPMELATRGERAAYAMRATGGGTAEMLWQFPWHSERDRLEAGQIAAHWQKMHDGRSNDLLLRQMVLAFRMWRPEVVLVDPIDSTDPLANLMREAVKEAFKQSADESIFPEQIRQLGLTGWAPKKVYAATKQGLNAPVSMEFSRVTPHLADTPKHVANKALPLIGDRAAVAVQHYRLVAARGNDALNHRDLMEAIDLAPGGTSRRELPPIDARRTQEIEQLETNLRHWQVLESLGTASGNQNQLASPDQVIGSLATTLKKLPDDHAAYGTALLARQYAAQGRWTLAREAYFLLVDRYPAHPLALEGYRWLARFHASGEARRRHELGQFQKVTETVIRPINSVALPNVGPRPQTDTESRLTLISDAAGARNWLEGSLEVEPRLAGFGPNFVRDPSIQMTLQSARRQLGKVDAAKQWYVSYLNATRIPGAEGGEATQHVWRDNAISELWVLDRSKPKPVKPLFYCKEALTRPHLDGQLNDAVWADLQPMVLGDALGQSATQSHATTVKWAHDAEFLYIGITCKRPAVAQFPEKPSKRGYDADLSGQDRVSLMLDLDRDYATYYRLEVDHRGLVADDCWGDRSWNPKWFVAVHNEPTLWTAELAIPIAELTGDPLTTGRIWACNAVRTIPNIGVQAWSRPADTTPRPEGMGLLEFVTPRRSR